MRAKIRLALFQPNSDGIYYLIIEKSKMRKEHQNQAVPYIYIGEAEAVILLSFFFVRYYIFKSSRIRFDIKIKNKK